MLLGEHEHSLDDKNRVTLPAKFRQAFADGVFVARGIDPCLLVYPPEGWHRLVEGRMEGLDPFSREAGARLYRTGDVVRYREDGEIEFIGRRDQQVKVRGYRIELGEIETAIREQEEVKEAVVIAEGEAADKRLVGYVVWQEGCGLSWKRLRERLTERLPDYMTPGEMVELEELPLKSFPLPGIVRPDHPYGGEEEGDGAHTEDDVQPRDEICVSRLGFGHVRLQLLWPKC